MRSGGNVSTITNNAPKEMQSSVMTTSVEDEKLVQTSKCKGSTTIPIFLKSTLLNWLNQPQHCVDSIASTQMAVVLPN